jgi:hypothetical protein
LTRRDDLRYTARMTSRPLLALITLAIALSTSFAQTKIELQPSDTVQTILEKQVGQTVELRMKSGEKIGGKLEKLNDKIAHLSALTGADYFDGVVVIDSIAAVVVRAKAK